MNGSTVDKFVGIDVSKATLDVCIRKERQQLKDFICIHKQQTDEYVRDFTQALKQLQEANCSAEVEAVIIEFDNRLNQLTSILSGSANGNSEMKTASSVGSCGGECSPGAESACH